MSADILAAIIGAVIGGAFSAGTGALLQRNATNSQIARLRKIFLIGIKDDLDISIRLYERIVDDWEKSKIVWYTSLHELNDSRSVYSNNKDHIALIETEELRLRIAKYYRESAILIVALTNAQTRRDNISREFQLILRDLRTRDINELESVLLSKAATIMGNESDELARLNNLHLPELVAKVTPLKQEADNLREKIKGALSSG